MREARHHTAVFSESSLYQVHLTVNYCPFRCMCILRASDQRTVSANRSPPKSISNLFPSQFLLPCASLARHLPPVPLALPVLSPLSPGFLYKFLKWILSSRIPNECFLQPPDKPPYTLSVLACSLLSPPRRTSTLRVL